MNNIINYAKTFPYSFEEKPFTEVDSLILCQLAYLRYEHAGLEKQGRRLQLAGLASLLEKPAVLENVPSKNPMLELMFAVSTDDRLRWLFATDYTSHTDTEIDKQFSATTYLFEDGTAYVAFRGTDGSVVGWRENFNMTYLTTVPSQQEAAAYLAAVADKHPGPIYVGGHSKGGNLAVFAAASSPRSVQNRILSVYSHDGPGFQKEFFDQEGYQRIKDRIHKTVPESAIIGMLLQHQEAYTVIESTEHGLFQHRALTWVVSDGHFSVKESVNKSAQAITSSFNAWTDTLDMAERKAIVDALFQIISATNAQTVHTLLYETIRNAPSVVKAISAMDPGTKQLLTEKLTELETLFQQSGGEQP